jgi:hypothetical protein
VRLHLQPGLHRLLRQQAGGQQHAGVAGVGAAGDGGDQHVAVADLEATVGGEGAWASFSAGWLKPLSAGGLLYSSANWRLDLAELDAVLRALRARPGWAPPSTGRA